MTARFRCDFCGADTEPSDCPHRAMCVACRDEGSCRACNDEDGADRAADMRRDGER